jgi:cardiolipin synthase A/B
MMTVIFQLPTLVWWSAILYAVIAGGFIILENKSTEKTLAWLLAFLLLPVIGVLIYLLVGREHYAFSRERRLLQQELGSNLLSNAAVLAFIREQPGEIKKLKQAGPFVYDRTVELICRNQRTPLYPYNCLEILQNASEKYPRLLADLQAAQHYIHMEYFEWASDEVMERFKEVLIERAQAGVEVRLIYDPLGCFFMLKRRYPYHQLSQPPQNRGDRWQNRLYRWP